MVACRPVLAADRQVAGLPLVLDHPRLMVVDKPAGLLCQPGLGSHQQDSLISRLQLACPALRLVHRLDRDTSGLVLLAKDPDMLRLLGMFFASRRVRKLYVADVQGQMKNVSGLIGLPLARLKRQPPTYGVHPGGKACVTLWRRLKLMESSTRLWLCPRTGRSHQLRAHLAALHHPIIGDPIYNPGCAVGLRLRAMALRFPDPDDPSGQVRVRAPWPAWFNA